MNIGYCLTGSFCTFEKAIAVMDSLVRANHNVTPVMSEKAYSTDTRFGTSQQFRDRVREITGNTIIHTIEQAEPIGPENMFDVLVIAPCTGNTLAKLAMGITDTSVTMATKSHLRNSKPVVIGVSTNDALGCAAKNIGALLNYRNYYFVPYGMDDCEKKPRSMVCDFSLVEETIMKADKGEEILKKIY